ncbi:MAG: hypothetical protein U0Z26_01435 [Anaerolineales bacterium]
MSSWIAFDEGKSIGKKGPEGDIILQDDEHIHGARITLKRGEKYVSVSCNIYKWMDHSRFFGTTFEAQREYEMMKAEITEVMNVITAENTNQIKVWEAISKFVRKFP